ncbi:MAG: HAMP domain-containing histidine kinase [Promethearchaeota archaeon]|nr:MAG: HAMP domain-containing histidine kinase [Candidatus Lokiarchaeota archaeon]
MSYEEIFDFYIAIYSVVAASIGCFSGFKNDTFRPWIPAFVTYGVGAIVIYFKYFDELFRLVGNLIFLVALLWIILIVFKEYFQLKKDVGNLGSGLKIVAIGFIFLLYLNPSEILLLIVRIGLLVLEITCIIMLFRIYQIKRTLTHAFLVLILIGAFIETFTVYLNSLALPTMRELNFIANFVFITLIVGTAFVAYVEQRLVLSERQYREAFNRAEFYKDLFVHDINNILQNISISSDLLVMEGDNVDLPKKKDLLNIIKEQVQRGGKLVTSIRKLSQIEEGQVSTRPIEVCTILKKVIARIKNLNQEKEVEIQLDCPYQELMIQGNELLIDVFENILLNAIKHNKNRRVEIQVILSKDQQCIKFQFQDNGIGISDARKRDIFQRSYSNQSRTKGLGLGLSLVKKIIRSYSGDIWVEDRVAGDPIQGSNFIVRIPEMKS